MGEKLKFKEAADKLFGADKKVRLIFIIGIAGILLIFLSSLFGGKGNENAAQGTQSFDSEQYVEKLEERIYTMVTGIQGVGKAKVMITLENTTEYIYESEKGKRQMLPRIIRMGRQRRSRNETIMKEM